MVGRYANSFLRRVVYDQPGLLYWSHLGITATVLNKGQWEYFTYSWEHFGVDSSAGEVAYGTNNRWITFPGELRATWEPRE